MDPSPASPALSHVVILGGGFGGLRAAKGLRRAPVRVTLVDRRNYHLFQPLLYQVATAALSPADIAGPIRHILARQRNCEVVLGEAVGVDVAARRVTLRDGAPLSYDYLVVATGATHSYFGHDDWASLAPGLKDIGDATEIRRRFLLAFEAAEQAPDDARARARLTFVVVGGGPTGVELAGAMAEIARRAIPKDFRHIDTATARVILVEGESRVLPGMNAKLGERAKRDLESLGVEVRLGIHVTQIDGDGVVLGSGPGAARIEAENVFWAAGVRASPLARMLSADAAAFDGAGRVRVGRDLSLPGKPEVFVVGDLARVEQGAGGMVPGVCPAAIQMGAYVGRVIGAESRGALHNASRARWPFRYRDKGLLATIGRARAVADIRGSLFAGYPAWLLWMGVHIFFLIGFRNRFLVMFQWAWAYVTFDRGARLIVGGDGDRARRDAQ